jgi:DNA-directed RNA polymerase specialized sigma24 family protein
MPYETIAQVLGVSSGAVRVKVHRARIRLTELRAARR